MDLRLISDKTVTSSTNQEISIDEKIDIDEVITKLSNCNEKIEDYMITLRNFKTQCETLLQRYRDLKIDGLVPRQDIVDDISITTQIVSLSSVREIFSPLLNVMDRIIREED